MATKPKNPSPIFDLPTFIPQNWINTTTTTTTTTSVENTNIIGEIIAYQGTSLPSANWLWCDGTSYDINLYPDLYNLIGINYGGVEGVSFQVPNLLGKTPVGSDATNIYTTSYAGSSVSSGGNKTMSGNQLATHSHSISISPTTPMLQSFTQNNAIQGIAAGSGDIVKTALYGQDNFTGTAGNAGNSADLLPPFNVSNFMIRAIVVL
jgi:microcystin-dependent protein